MKRILQLSMLGLCSFLIVAAVALGEQFSGSVRAANVPDPGAVGPYAVGHTSFTVLDQSRDTTSAFRGRPLAINVWYPVDASSVVGDSPRAIYYLDPVYGRWPVTTSSNWEAFGMEAAYEGLVVASEKPFPFVVFSPGRGGRYTSYMFTALRLASHGFVVAIVQHYHDGVYAWDPQERIDLTLFNRPRDVLVMLNEVLARNYDPQSVLFNAVRPDLVAAAGHSLGGYAALTLAGGDDAVCATDTESLPAICNSLGSTDRDPRIKAVVSIDGSNQFLHFGELARITVPYGEVGQAAEKPDVQSWQARPHAAISAHPSYRVDVRTALHNSFQNSCLGVNVVYSVGAITLAQRNAVLAGPTCVPPALDQAEGRRLAAKYAIAFLKSTLAGEPGYQEFLTPGTVKATETVVEFFVTEPQNPRALGEDPATFLYFEHQPGTTPFSPPTKPSNAPTDPATFGSVDEMVD
jgi:predicted dienelactone hydrolase